MEKDKSTDASREGQDVTLEDLYRAADAITAGDEKEEKKPSGTESSLAPAVDKKTEEPKTDEPKIEEPKAEEPKVDEPKTSEPKAEAKPPDDNAERSKLGRKVKFLEDTIEQLRSEIEASRQKKTATDDEGEFTPPQTREEFFALLDERERRKAEERQAEQKSYSAKYLDAVTRLGVDEDEALQGEIMKELVAPTSPYNVRYSNDPTADAERNYYKAKTHLLAQKVKLATAPKPPMNPLKGEPPKVPMGVSGDSKVTGKGKPEIKLSPEAKEYIRRTGMTSKEVEEALAEEESVGMRTTR